MLGLGARVREVTLEGLQEVVAEEEATEGVLHSAAHFHQVFQNVLRGHLLRLDVHRPDCHKEIKATQPRTVSFMSCSNQRGARDEWTHRGTMLPTYCTSS